MDINNFAKQFWHEYMLLQRNSLKSSGLPFFEIEYPKIKEKYISIFNKFCLGGLFTLTDIDLEWCDNEITESPFSNHNFLIYLMLVYRGHFEKIKYLRNGYLTQNTLPAHSA